MYDPADGGHLRIEMRALPAGPTAIDMVANAALLIGLAEGLRPRIAELLPAIPFGLAEYNFYRAAQHGLDAQLVWPMSGQSGNRERAVGAILKDMLPVARQGLDSIGIDSNEAAKYLGVIEHRLERRQTGASWQRAMLAGLREQQTSHDALHTLLEVYMEHSANNQPVAQWPL